MGKIIIVFFILAFSGNSLGKEQPSEPQFDKKKTVSASYIVTSDYIWRGYSQTTNKPAFQGDFNLIITKSPIRGLYANFWFSNVRFLEEELLPREKAYIEFDGSIGISNEINKKGNYDFSFHRYQYPGTEHYSYNEVTGSLQYLFLTSFLAFTNNVYDTGGKALYYNLGFDFDLSKANFLKLNQVHFKGGIGRHRLPLVADFPSYTDYNLELNKTINSFLLTILWTKSSNHLEPFGGSRVSFSIAINL
ncbi:MAG: hypothetical protein H0U57_01850 [Tatlockia sp.]|nr:hypothetical protein [Tatlockia sp.]